MADNVNHPAHYASKFQTKPIECIDITRHMSFLTGNAFKYVWRAGTKGDVEKAQEDLDKALFYISEAVVHGGDSESGVIDTNPVATAVFELLVPDNSHRYEALHGIIYGYVPMAITSIRAMKEDFAQEEQNG